MSPLLLGLLALVDGTLCGFRAAAGRNPRLFLRAYYRASMLRAAALATAVIVVFLLAALGLRALHPPAFEQLVRAADAMVLVYGAYAVVVLAALALYLTASFDLGILATVLVLGPFTLARPVVIAAGALVAALSTRDVVATSFAVLAAAVMLGFERLLELGKPPWKDLPGR